MSIRFSVFTIVLFAQPDCILFVSVLREDRSFWRTHDHIYIYIIDFCISFQKPQLADKRLMVDALNRSENSEIEKAMLEDKLRATDWEATNEALEKQVAQDSYLQWVKENEMRNRKKYVSYWEETWWISFLERSQEKYFKS